MHQDFRPLLAAVQKNCNISDAVHAGDYTLCVYLLKMREYFRWEKGYAFSAPLPNSDVGSWLKERERLWESLENESFTPIPLSDTEVDPFDTDNINRALNPHGLVYSAGLGQYGRPHFFLGELEQQQEHEAFRVLISANEFARDLAAPPAMTLGETIYVRRESLRRMIWEKIEEWRWNKLDNPMGRAIQCYDFEQAPDDALEQMTDHQISTLLLHEIGEIMAHAHLGEDWERMLAALPRSRTELSLRAIRDHLADSLSTLPTLLAEDQASKIHFYFAMLTNLRKSLAPELLLAYDEWRSSGSRSRLDDYIPAAQAHWRELTQQVMELHGEGAPLATLQTLIDSRPL